MSEQQMPAAIKLLDDAGIAYRKKNQTLRITIDKAAIGDKAETWTQIACLIKESYKQ
jgi:hypothetical protein